MIDWCNRAVTYLRPDLSDDTSDADVKLSHEDSPVLREFGNGLLVAYVVDEGDKFDYVQERHLMEAGIGVEDIHCIGIQNLSVMAQDRLKVRNSGSIYAAFLDGNFEASLLLINGLWDTGLRHLVSKRYAACIPARDILAFCDADSEAGLVELKAVVDRVTPNGDHLLTTDLYIWQNGLWTKIGT